MVNSLALLVPAGLIRQERLATHIRLLQLGNLLIPSSILEKLVMKRLTQPLFESRKDNTPPVGDDFEEDPWSVRFIYIPQNRADSHSSNQKEVQASLRYPHVTVSETMRWTMQNHKGFYNSFMSIAKHMHGTGQLERWKLLRDRPDKTLIIAASHDPIIVAGELHKDATKALGDKLDWKILEGDHSITITRPKEIVEAICHSWRLEDMTYKADSGIDEGLA